MKTVRATLWRNTPIGAHSRLRRLVNTSRLRLTEDPHGFLHEVIGEFVAEADGGFVGSTGESSLQGGNVFTLGLDAGFVVLRLGREFFLEFGRNVHGFEEAQSLVGMLRDSEAHTETEFSVVFEEAVGPSRTAAFLVLCPRSGRQVTAVNGGATRSVGDNHAVAEQLRNETHVSGFAAACAGAGEFEQRFEEHGLLDEVLVDLGTVEFRKIDEEVPALAFLNLDGFLRHHVDGLLGFVGLVLTDIFYLGVSRLGCPRRVGLYFNAFRSALANRPQRC